ncbi:hypothetical protein [Spirosoma aerolatum]|uniref:hypothetical protein n=1 Tax=Spirosoma aerolatum TaxID=1211326 RepID=UPI0009AD9969|nr:hypothetical protein [Spirosoma aerolatum]
MLTPATIVLIGGAITLLLTYVATRMTEKENKEDQQKLKDELVKKSEEYASKVDDYARLQRGSDKEIKALQMQLIKKAEDQAAKNEEIAELNKQLRLSAEKIAKLSQETKEYITGENTFCYATLDIHSGAAGNTFKAALELQKSGKYTLQAIDVLILNADYGCENFARIKSGKSPVGNLDPIEENTFEINRLTTGERKQIGYIPYSVQPEKRYNLRFRASNGYGEWFQRIVFRKIPSTDIYVWATQIYLMNEKGEETIIKEGSEYWFRYDSKRGTKITEQHMLGTVVNIELNSTWAGFPLKKGETSPWIKNCRVHINGNNLFFTDPTLKLD